MIFPYGSKHTPLYIISVWNTESMEISAVIGWVGVTMVWQPLKSSKRACLSDDIQKPLENYSLLHRTYLYTWFRGVLSRDCPTWHKVDIEWISTAKSILTTRSFLKVFEILFRISTRQTLDAVSSVCGDRKDIVVSIASFFKTPHHMVFPFLVHTWSSLQLAVEVAQDSSSGKAAHVWISYKPENKTKYSWVNAVYVFTPLTSYIDILTCVSLMQHLTRALYTFFLSGRREKDTGYG